MTAVHNLAAWRHGWGGEGNWATLAVDHCACVYVCTTHVYQPVAKLQVDYGPVVGCSKGFGNPTIGYQPLFLEVLCVCRI